MKRIAPVSTLASVALASGVGLVAGSTLVDGRTAGKSPLADMPADVQDAVAEANDLSLAFRTVSRAVLPAVVSIENRPNLTAATPVPATPNVPGSNLPAQDPNNPFKGTPFEDFFGPGSPFGDGGFGGQSPFGPRMNPGRRGGPRMMPGMPRPGGGSGSGVIIDSDGIVLTNNHVVAGGGTVTIRTSDGREFTASEVLTDPSTDIAVVKFDPDGEDLTPAQLGDSDNVDIGDWVLALGQPFSLENTVTAGIISATKRGIGINERENFLQTDAAINPGNSGGPLVNLQGQVIGINTAIKSRSGGNDGIGFAVPSNLVRWVSDQLLDTGKVRRAYLGIGIQPVNAELARELDIPPRSGVLVTDVMKGTPAADMGLQSGDVILKFDGQRVSKPSDLQLVVERSKFGEEVDVRINRAGEEQTLTYTPTERPSDFGKNPGATGGSDDGDDDGAAPTSIESLGISVENLSDETAEALGVDVTEGVVITEVADGGPGAAKGLAPGMVITQAARQKVADVDTLREILEGEDGSVLLLVKDQRGSRFVVIERK